MALKMTFQGVNISLPGYDGWVKCPKCNAGTGNPLNGGGAYKKAGPITRKDGTFFYWSSVYCFECHHHEEINGEERKLVLAGSI